MKKIKFFPLLLLLCLVFASASPAAYALDEPSLGVGACVLADLSTGEILFSKNMDDRRSPASLTKVMTVLLAVEAAERGEVSLGDMVTAQSDCRIYMEEDSSTSGIMPGEVMSLKDLMYCAMLQSANEACNIIASHVGGSIDGFVAMMNERADELGCKNTHFVTTNGLSADGHYSSAYDLYLITSEAISHPVFMQMCNTLNYEVPATNMSDVRKLANSNALLTPDAMYNVQYGNNYVYEGAAGVKTGYTRAAGYCLLSTCERNDIHAIAVVMGCDGPLNAGGTAVGSFVDSRKLYDWLYDNFSYQTLVSPKEQVQQVTIEFAKDDSPVFLYTQGTVELLLPNDLDMNTIAKNVTVYEDKLVAPINAGDVLGEMTVVSEGKSYGTIDLVASRDVEMSKSEYIRSRIADFFGKSWILGIIIAVLAIVLIYLLLVARYKRLRRKYLREKKRADQRRREERERYIEQRRIREEQEYYSQHKNRTKASGYPQQEDNYYECYPSQQQSYDNYSQQNYGDYSEQQYYDDSYSQQQYYNDSGWEEYGQDEPQYFVDDQGQYYDQYGRPVYFDEYGRPYYADYNGWQGSSDSYSCDNNK